MTKQKIIHILQRYYVAIMMAVVGRALVALSRIDKQVQQEIKGFSVGTIIEMMVMPNGPGFKVIVNDQHALSIFKGEEALSLSIQFKHISHAFLVFSFQEGTAKAFANDRMIAEGDLAYAIRLVRCLNKLEATILPKFIAKLAVKRYPNISLFEKLSNALRIYASVAKQMITGS